jgi:NAD(P)-dependent dehydrogenase (short-subunit alcohol dehydrogenase family)
MKKLEGKIAVVTGGNSGIGLATAKLLRQEGAKVAISGRDQATLTAAVKEIGGDTLAIRADVTSIKDMEAFFADVVQRFGKIDVLFANAGVAKFAPIGDSPEALYDEVFDINVKARREPAYTPPARSPFARLRGRPRRSWWDEASGSML